MYKDNFPSNKVFELDKIKNVLIDGENALSNLIHSLRTSILYTCPPLEDQGVPARQLG